MPVLWTLAILIAEPPGALAVDPASNPHEWAKSVQLPETGLVAIGYLTPLELTVLPDGRVADCRASKYARRSPASALLQRLVCDALIKSARFLPPRDVAGEAIAGRTEVYALLGAGPGPGKVGAPDVPLKADQPKLRPVPLVSPLAPPAPAPVLSRGVRPFGQVDQWISNADIPTDFIASTAPGASASTRFKLDIDRSGAVSGCSILRSSGVASLDAATCSVMSARAHFEPALDNLGVPTAGTWSSTVRWLHPSK